MKHPTDPTRLGAPGSEAPSLLRAGIEARRREVPNPERLAAIARGLGPLIGPAPPDGSPPAQPPAAPPAAPLIGASGALAGAKLNVLALVAATLFGGVAGVSLWPTRPPTVPGPVPSPATCVAQNLPAPSPGIDRTEAPTPLPSLVTGTPPDPSSTTGAPADAPRAASVPADAPTDVVALPSGGRFTLPPLGADAPAQVPSPVETLSHLDSLAETASRSEVLAPVEAPPRPGALRTPATPPRPGAFESAAAPSQSAAPAPAGASALAGASRPTGASPLERGRPGFALPAGPPGGGAPAAVGAPPGSSELSEAGVLLRARKVLRASPAEALALCTEHERRHPGGPLSQEREVMAIEALMRLGRRGEATERAQHFFDSYPESAHHPRIEALVGR